MKTLLAVLLLLPFAVHAQVVVRTQCPKHNWNGPAGANCPSCVAEASRNSRGVRTPTTPGRTPAPTPGVSPAVQATTEALSRGISTAIDAALQQRNAANADPQRARQLLEQAGRERQAEQLRYEQLLGVLKLSGNASGQATTAPQANPLGLKLGQSAQPIGKFSAIKGDVRVETPDGRTVSGADLAAHTLTLNSKVTTGPDARVTVRLSDDSTFTLGPDSVMIMDEFVYDPASGGGKKAATVVRGVFRFISAKIAKDEPKDVLGWRFRMPAGTIGTRGTEFETLVRPDGSGQVRLFSGQLEITKKLDGAKFLLEARQSVTFDAAGKFAAPQPIEP